ncbi:hypothetical protein Hanom_Chr10g00884561 [Helianthus anomalus]
MQNKPPFMKSDLESGTTGTLYPTMTESPELRWSFIRKVYSIVAIQLLLTVAVGAVVVSFHPIVTFLTTTTAGLACYIILIITPFISRLLLPISFVTFVLFWFDFV